MSRVKNQHYVPRFYLKGFSPEKEKVYVYDKSESKFFFASVKHIANENYFYDDEKLDKVTGKDQFLEKFFHPLEQDISKILANLIDKLEHNKFKNLKKETRAKLAIFLTYQFLRTKETREDFRQTLELITKTFSDLQLEALGKEEADYEVNTDEAAYQASMILKRENIEQIANILNNHIWMVLVNKTNIHFYTSDHPLVKKGNISHPFKSMKGLASPGIEICFPINPNFALLLAEKSVFKDYLSNDGKILEITDEQNVIHYNCLQVMQSYRQIYSYDNNFELAEKVINENPHYGNLDRTRTVIANKPKINPQTPSFFERTKNMFKRILEYFTA